MYLLNWKSRIVHFDGATGLFFDRSVDDIDHETVIQFLVAKGDARPAERFVYNRDTTPEQSYSRFPFSNIVIRFDTPSRTVSLRDEADRYFCWDTPAGEFSFSRKDVSLWESFMLIDSKSITVLKSIIGKSWVAGRNGVLIESKDIKFSDEFSLKIGDYRLDLRYQAFEMLKEFELTAFVDGWKVEKFYLFKPVIYITAYSDQRIFEQLRLCVLSLLDIGLYSGKIVVMTNRNQEEVEHLLQTVPPDRLEVCALEPTDFVGFVCSKYSIENAPQLAGFQPVMYVDPDIIFDRPIVGMLVAATATEKICVPMEDFHLLRSHPPVGGTLMQLDRLEPRFTAGFNGGTIIFPNTENELCRNIFNIIQHVIANIGDIFGRKFNGWADQEVANYIGYKMGGFNTSVISRFVQHHLPQEPREQGGRGLVHFWGHTTDEKLRQMQIYLTFLYEHLKLPLPSILQIEQ